LPLVARKEEGDEKFHPILVASKRRANFNASISNCDPVNDHIFVTSKQLQFLAIIMKRGG